MDTNTIVRVCSSKFLGIIIDDQLNWMEHIDRVRNRLCKSFGIMYKARHLLSNDSLYTLYCSLFLPYINYCSEIWEILIKQMYILFISLRRKRFP